MASLWPTPSIQHLFTHEITLEDFIAGPHGTLATPVPATRVVTGRFQVSSRIVRDANGVERASTAVVFLPAGTAVGTLTKVWFLGKVYRIISINAPSFEATASAFVECRLQ